MAIFKSPIDEGPGVSKSEAEKRGFFRFFELLKRYYGKLLSTGLLKMLLDLTVVASGLGAVGNARIARIAARDRHSFKSDFSEAIKKNLKQALAMGIINNILSGAALFSAYFIFNENASNENADAVSFLMLALSIAVLLIITFMRYYTSAVLITFNVTLGQLYKNSLLLSIGGIGRNFIILLSHMAVLALICSPMLLDLYVGLGIAICLYILIMPAFSGFCIQYNIFPVMMKYMIEPFMKEHPGEGENTLRELGLIESDTEAVMSDETTA